MLVVILETILADPQTASLTTLRTECCCFVSQANFASASGHSNGPVAFFYCSFCNTVLAGRKVANKAFDQVKVG